MEVNRKTVCRLLLAGATMLAATAATQAKDASSPAPVWHPTSQAAHPEDYAGPAKCVGCHRGKARQMGAEMGQSVPSPVAANILGGRAELSWQRGPYTYTVRNDAGKATFTVADGKSKIVEPVFTVIGSGTTFQAYLVQHNGQYYRVAVDYFAAQGKLNFDAEAASEAVPMPASLDAAVGKRLSADDVRGCFRCHSPSSVVAGKIDTASLAPGIGCEVCHGPGAKHVAAVQAGNRQEPAIFNPAHLAPQQKSALCNECHTSAEGMKKQNPQGTKGVVCPAYRLESSRCWNASDERSQCTACHNSHAPQQRQTAAYDAQCLACHTTGGAVATASHPGKSCPSGKGDCVGCHMPKVSVPNSPYLFTDHRIRIAKAGAPFPE
jgi:hypothetical protein